MSFEHLKKIKLFGPKDDQNVNFIFGCPRGGTTWLWSLLESHQDVVAFTNEKKNKEGKYVTSESGIYIKNPRRAKTILNSFAKKNKEKVIIEKTPSHTLIYPLILTDFPNSKHIVIFRHPLAIANSMIQSEMKAFEKYDLEKSIVEIKKYYHALKNLSTEYSFIYITYEQLLIDTESVLRKIFKHLELKQDNLSCIINENASTSKILINGAFRSGKTTSYLTELTDEQKTELNTELEQEILFYYSQYEKYEDSCCQ